ncbi:hypothetical protein ACFQX7_35595 [Luedemannella flava]
MEPPVWLLDVDGVLNVQRPGWGAAPRRGMAVSMGEAWPMRWAPALIRRIREIHRTGVAEVRWCSTWCPDADQVERLFGLPPLARALTGRPRAGMAGDAAKLAAAQAVISDEGRALIWTDDTAVPDEGRGATSCCLVAGCSSGRGPRAACSPDTWTRSRCSRQSRFRMMSFNSARVSMR